MLLLFFVVFILLAAWGAGDFIDFYISKEEKEIQSSSYSFSSTYSSSSSESDKKFLVFLKRGIKIGAVVLCVAITLFGSFYNIGEQEQAVVTTFGVPQTVTKKGLNFKIPYIQKVQKVDTTMKGSAIGYNPQDNSKIESESLMITNDYNFINTDFYIERSVTDPVKFLYASEDPDAILKLITQSSIRDTVGVYSADDVLTTGKIEIQNKIKQSIVKKLEKRNIGIALNTITMQDSEPPTAEVSEAFKRVESAKQKMDEAVNDANKDANEKIPAANAKADEILQNAETKKTTRINEAKKAVELFNATYAEYVKNSDVTKKRMFYETMEDVLPNMKVVIGDNTNTILPLDKFIETGKSE